MVARRPSSSTVQDAALAVVAALLGSGHAEVLAQQVEQSDAVVDGAVCRSAPSTRQGDIGEVG